MSDQTPDQAWSFTNSRGRVITTHNVVDAEKYRADRNFREVTDTPAAEQVDSEGGVKPYKDWLKGDLEREVEARNDATGDDEPFIEVAAPGNKPELIAALEADDAHRADA
ncbi:MAG: hypothetical protein HOV78_11645 [Hamadaea sp.]|nr:hypothetical protein [Hamadaea sp.]